VSEATGYLCVGGPADGHIVAVLAGTFRVPVRQAATATYDPPGVEPQPAKVEQIVYVLQKLYSRRVMVPDGQSMEETERLLLENYRGGKA
jgi:hypothetical protein